VTRLGKGAEYAKSLFVRLNLTAPIDAIAIAGKLQLNVNVLEVEGFDGALIRARGTPFAEIVVRSSIKEQGRRNFTIAHELGHFILPNHDSDDVVCTPAEVNDWSTSARDREREANEFAAELLMPADVVGRAIGPLDPSFDAIQKIGDICNSSLSASAWRFCDLTGHRCAMVWSSGGHLIWERRSPEFRFRVSRQGISEHGTFAYDCLKGKSVPKSPQPVDAAYWIDSPNLQRDTKIWEQSKALPSYNAVFTLLWIRERIELFSDQDEDELLPELKPRRC
jgi:hypothetical protein